VEWIPCELHPGKPGERLLLADRYKVVGSDQEEVLREAIEKAMHD